MAIDEVGTAAIWTATIDTAPSAGVGTIEIGGDAVQITVASGDTANDVATALAAAINAYYDELSATSLPVTAGAATNVVTITARHKGQIFNSLDLHLPEGGNVFTGNVTVAVDTAGTGDPDASSGLAAIGDMSFDWQSWTFSDTSNLTRYKDALDDVSGRWSYLRQSYGHITATVTGTVSEITTIGQGQNDRHKSMVQHFSAIPSAPWRWDAAMLALQVPWLSDGALGNVSRNQTGRVVKGLRGPRDPSLYPDYATRNALLKSGVSTWSINSAGEVVLDKWITTYQKNALGLTDTTFRDIQAMGQVMYAFRRFRTFLFDEHGQKAIADSNPTDLGALTTTKDIVATMDRARRTMPGVLENAQFVAQRNPDNANRVDILAALDRVNPLDVIAANGKLYNQFSEANGLAA